MGRLWVKCGVLRVNDVWLYFRRYGDGLIREMGLVVAACLRQVIFAGVLVEDEEPHQEIIAQAKATGRMPPARAREAVLERRNPDRD